MINFSLRPLYKFTCLGFYRVFSCYDVFVVTKHDLILTNCNFFKFERSYVRHIGREVRFIELVPFDRPNVKKKQLRHDSSNELL